ncbi:MAG TPA: CHAT domain-containing protein, partial [Solirubrobacter sp.]
LAELRRVSAALDESLRDGRPDASLTRRQAALERSVRRRALRARGATSNIHGVRPSLETLGDRTLVEFFALDGRLHAVTVTDDKPALHRLGAEAEVNREVASLRFSLRSLATARPGSRAADAMAGICTTVARRLDQLLIAPLSLAHDAPLVLVPTGELHALPWSLLTSLAHRPLSVAPSLKLWQRANDAPPATGAVLVAGPRLPAATEEIETLTRRHPHAVALTGPQATVSNVATALDGADTAHLAAHGHFRDDNPSFCSLELADGALTVYDLERLHKTPRRLVLSSCESGLSTVHAGDELMGFTAAMFSLGTATVIAAVVPVPDEATKGLMLALDEELRNGTPPAAALVRARDAIDADENHRTVARAAFVCFGAG